MHRLLNVDTQPYQHSMTVTKRFHTKLYKTLWCLHATDNAVTVDCTEVLNLAQLLVTIFTVLLT